MKDKEIEIISEMEKLKNFHSTQRSKYRRNLRMFEYSPTLSLDNLTDAQCVGYYQQGFFDVEDDTTSSVQENIIRSVIETLVSRVASQKVRPFFNTVNASFREMQVTKQAQQFFDNMYDEQNVNKTVVRAFQDSCVLETGVIYIDRDLHSIQRVMPWQVYIDPREASYGKITKLAWEQQHFPTSLLALNLKEYERDEVTLWQYWDLNKGKKYYYIPEISHFEEETWDADVIPFEFMNYSIPLKGTSGNSVVDMLYGLQMEIDAILTKIKDASQLAAPLTYFVPEGSSIKVNKLSNRTGEIITYTASPNMTGSPVTVATHPFMDPQWTQLLDKFKQDAFEIVGVSQLSSQMQKPKGLNSGIALATYEDIEDSRFETQLNNVIRSYVDIAKLYMQIVPGDANILPENRLRQSIKWADIVEMRDQMIIQFSAADSLSKDPSEKLKQLQALHAAGLIPQSRIAQLMDLPDLQLGYTLANNAINAVLTVIDNCIEKDIYEWPDCIPTDMLMDEILSTQLSLFAAGGIENRNATDIAKLDTLYKLASEKDMNSMTNAEMSAVGQLNQEMQQDLADPNGQINSQINQAITNNTEGLIPGEE